MPPVLPMYHQIRKKIQESIISKEYGPGELIPSENEMAKFFGVTRMTVRQAISLLTQEGLLLRKRGTGTFVTTDTKLLGRFSLDFTGFMDELVYQAAESKTISARIETIRTPKVIKEKLQIDDDEIIKIERVRTLRGQVFAFTVNYLPTSIGQQIDINSLYQKPLLKILETDMGIELNEAFQTIEASFADQYVAENLGLEMGSSILFVERTMYDNNSVPFEIVQSSYRGDIYKYVVRLKLKKGDKKKKWVQYEE